MPGVIKTPAGIVHASRPYDDTPESFPYIMNSVERAVDSFDGLLKTALSKYTEGMMTREGQKKLQDTLIIASRIPIQIYDERMAELFHDSPVLRFTEINHSIVGPDAEEISQPDSRPYEFVKEKFVSAIEGMLGGMITALSMLKKEDAAKLDELTRIINEGSFRAIEILAYAQTYGAKNMHVKKKTNEQVSDIQKVSSTTTEQERDRNE